MARSGFGDLVDAVEVVAEKDVGELRAACCAATASTPAPFCMVGNSLRSDAAPVLDLGGWAVHVPHELTWALEHHDDEDAVRGHPRFRELPSLVEVPVALQAARLSRGRGRR